MLDTEPFVVSLPWVLREPVRRWFVPDILARYHDPRTVLVDLAANLLKEGLDELVPHVVRPIRTGPHRRRDPP